MKIEISYYDDSGRLSNSNIGWFIKGGPYYFYQKLNNLLSEDTSSMRIGRLIHMYILQKTEFWDNYVVNNVDAPKSAQQRDFCTYFIAEIGLSDEYRAIEAYKKVYSIKGQSDIKVAENALKCFEGLKDYINFLQTKGAKEEMSWSEFTRVKTIYENIKLHKKANELLFNTDISEWDCFNEFHINWEYESDSFNVSCKSLLDRVMFKKDYSEVILMDLKTTGNVHNFKKSFDEYDYGRQMYYYQSAIKWYLKNKIKLSDKQINKIVFKTFIVAIGSNNEIKLYEVPQQFLEERKELIENTIEQIVWHSTNNLWDYTKDYYEGDGIEILK